MSGPKRPRRLAAAVVVVLLMATGCGSGGGGGTTGSPTTAAPAGGAPGGAAGTTTPAAAPGATPSTPAAPGGPGATTPAGTPIGGAQDAGATGPGPFVGLWAGEYKSIVPADAGGTFTVVFQGSAPDYTGSIVIAGLCEPDCSITAKVTGNAISFGSVGARAVTYQGTISGNSMSGTYTVGTEGQGHGTWKAVKG